MRAQLTAIIGITIVTALVSTGCGTKSSTNTNTNRTGAFGALNEAQTIKLLNDCLKDCRQRYCVTKDDQITCDLAAEYGSCEKNCHNLYDEAL